MNFYAYLKVTFVLADSIVAMLLPVGGTPVACDLQPAQAWLALFAGEKGDMVHRWA